MGFVLNGTQSPVEKTRLKGGKITTALSFQPKYELDSYVILSELLGPVISEPTNWTTQLKSRGVVPMMNSGDKIESKSNLKNLLKT